MGGNYLSEPMAFLVSTLIGIYILLLMLRLLLQWARADFYNPISQALVKVTSPVLVPLRRVVPPLGPIDTASVLAMLGLQLLSLWLATAMRGQNWSGAALAVFSVWELINLMLNIFLVCIIVRVIMSWVGSTSHHPALLLIDQLADKLTAPLQRYAVMGGGIDFSPAIVMLGIFFLKMLLQPIFLDLARTLS
jgi:YggT family protein